MSPGKGKRTKRASPPPVGSGPGGRITRDDLQAKLRDIRGDVDETVSDAKPYALYAGVGAALLVILLAFLLGKSRGKKKSPIVEIRRR